MPSHSGSLRQVLDLGSEFESAYRYASQFGLNDPQKIVALD